MTTDGPFVDGKELLGGVIIIEVDGWETALAMAGEWPSLLEGPGAGVQVEAVTEH
ncbi:MAG: YciI family protein [Chloroflexota bacterium]